MKRYNILNNAFGWLMFLVAAVVYCSTIEPTASFWDCPEFITTGYRLEIGHPPGAPFFMLVANLFSQFAGEAANVAKMVNTMSALLSAGCILFLFWTITHLLRRLICRQGKVETFTQAVAILGSGVVGALVYTFSDTFWFSAVEGEVYAFSSFFTALVFWLILKWEDNAHRPGADRWLVLIAYLMGLSVGVHLLNLLCIPAMVLIFYYRRYPQAGVKGSLWALVISFVLIAVILYGVVPGIVKVGGWFELLFVNVFGMPFNTGLIVYLIILVSVVVCAIWQTAKAQPSSKKGGLSKAKWLFILSVVLLGIPFFGNGVTSILLGIALTAVLFYVLFILKKVAEKADLRRMLNTTLLCFLMLMIGYSTYALIMIRSAANPPMDQNSPEDIFTIGDYLARDQYGSAPLLYGPTFNSQVEWMQDPDDMSRLIPKRSEGKDIYQRKEKTSPDEPDSYEKVGSKSDYIYAQNMLFPRIWDSGHAGGYQSWLGELHYSTVDYDPGNGQIQQVEIPSQIDNISFFASYQLGFMYWRYFMWNFCGRQNDKQGVGETEYGNWITGIPFIDNMRLGDQSQLPDELKENKGHNVYYALPLLLGLFGLFWQAFRGRKGGQQFWVVFFLFFMTGIAIVIYLNQTPAQPRERDYAYAGSFYAFAIWVGMGVAAIIDWLRRIKITHPAVAVAVSLACVLVPVQMASQNWDDHDRSGRYACRDFGQNYLNTLQEGSYPIIFTNGDNDTFPLWYNQDTEGVRQDARVCNLSYLQTDWYIDQMCRPAYSSPAVPISWDRAEYVTGQNDYVRIQDLKEDIKKLYAEQPEEAARAYGDNPFELKNILKYWVRNPEANIIPTDSIVITIDKDAVRRSKMLIADSTGQIPDHMVISLKGRSVLYKPSLMMLEMLANCNWERPLYIAITVGRDNFLGLDANLIQEGLAYRISPFPAYYNNMSVDVDKMYDNVMNKYKFGNVSDPSLYIDETMGHMCLTNRRMFAILADQLVKQGDLKRAKLVLERADKEIPQSTVSYSDRMGGTRELAFAWSAVGNKAKADELLTIYARTAEQYLNWYVNYSAKPVQMSAFGCNVNLSNLYAAILGFEETGNKTLAERYTKVFERYYNAVSNAGIDIQLEP
ncbi:MAG: DUF2723 domain-containing protein [Bacteroidaceae bacterium]|nr:DUF2723 domain-containing protein [Bacteroidaceae bacterium]